jgi:hypothetical protein
MRNDQIFVLLLVILLPMSGCFDGGTEGVGEAEAAQDADGENPPSTSTSATAAPNLPPVISVETIGTLTNVEGPDCTTLAFEIEVRHAMTDWDGSILSAGWDVNLDGLIDYPTNASEGYMMIEIPMNTMVGRTAIQSNIEYEYREQTIVFGAQDDDGAWTSSELIKLVKTISYSTNNGGEYSYLDLEPCNDFSDVTDYNFSVIDHADFVSTGNRDYLVEITRTNGQNGIDWSRISIYIDGDNEGQEVCGVVENYYNRCRIYSGTGLTNSSVGTLWESGETITISEWDDNLHNGNYGAWIYVYIDNIEVHRVQLDLQ